MRSRLVVLAPLAITLFLGGCRPAVAPTLAPTAIVATATPGPTRTPRPTHTPPPTLTPTPSPTPAPATATPAPTRTLRPTLDLQGAAAAPVATAVPAPRAVAGPPVLLEPGESGSTIEGGTVFRWSWPGETLRDDEYFQPQIFHNGVYYGVVPPTKGDSAAVDPTVRMVLPGVPGYAWVDVTEEYPCCDDPTDPTTCRRCTVVVGRERAYDPSDWSPVHVQWVVAVIQWDGVDPAHLGPVVARSAPRPLRV